MEKPDLSMRVSSHFGIWGISENIGRTMQDTYGLISLGCDFTQISRGLALTSLTLSQVDSEAPKQIGLHF
jgi:hypothetical protein